MGIMTDYDLVQGTQDWHDRRRGIITASNVKTLITPTGKIAKNAGTEAYALTLAAERINGFSEEGFTSYDTERGHFQEVLARNIYSEHFEQVVEAGIIINDDFGFKLGASPDGLVGKEGGIEIKSRLGKFQIQTILADQVPAEYMMQIQATLLISGRKWWDFVQYSNGMKLFVKRVEPNEELQELIIKATTAMEARINEIVAEYLKKSNNLPYCDYVPVSVAEEDLSEAGL